MPTWYVYMLRCADKTLYIGMTNNLENRLAKHNAGVGAKYTRSRKPVVLVWQKRVKNESFARKREAKMKQMTRAEKEVLLAREVSL